MNELPQNVAATAPEEMELGMLPPHRLSTSKEGGCRPGSLDLTELNLTNDLSSSPSPFPSAPASASGGHGRYSRSPSPSVRVVEALQPTDGGWAAYSFLAAAFAAEALV